MSLLYDWHEFLRYHMVYQAPCGCAWIDRERVIICPEH